MIKHITVNPGETLVITVPQEGAPPVAPEEKNLSILVAINGVSIYANEDQSYVCFKSDLDICNDGCGPAHGDPYHQPQTAYYSGGREGNKYLNADVDKYIVIPPKVRSMTKGVVMGCRGRVTNLKTQIVKDGVIGEIGPDTKQEKPPTAWPAPSTDGGTQLGDSNKDYMSCGQISLR